MDLMTAIAPPLAARPPSAPPQDTDDVLGLDGAEALAWITGRRRAQDAAAAEELRGVCHWADLHRVRPGWGAVDREAARLLEQTSTPGELGAEGELRLSGQGAFMVAEFAVAELAAALGLSEASCRAYVGQAVELRDRLPRCFQRMVDGALPAWKARQIAQQTLPLSAAGADFVDAALAPYAGRLSLSRILRCVGAAMLRFDPELAERKAAEAAERRGVWLEDHLDGTTSLSALADTPDAAALDVALSGIAAVLADLGDEDPLQVRRARGLGVLADPQYALDLTRRDPATDAPRPRARRSTSPLHVHLHLTAVEGVVGEVARVDGYGPRTRAAVEQWLAGLTPGTTVRVTPVVDLTATISVDAYEIPVALHDQVAERDLCCQFPWCGRRGRRWDGDHIVEYVPLDDGGPPGQTSTGNLARLCRFHHRLKTHSSWTYERDPDSGTLLWTSPLGRRYAVDPTGTLPR